MSIPPELDSPENQILSALSEREYKRLPSSLEAVSFCVGVSLRQQGELKRYVRFVVARYYPAGRPENKSSTMVTGNGANGLSGDVGSATSASLLANRNLRNQAETGRRSS